MIEIQKIKNKIQNSLKINYKYTLKDNMSGYREKRINQKNKDKLSKKTRLMAVHFSQIQLKQIITFKI